MRIGRDGLRRDATERAAVVAGERRIRRRRAVRVAGMAAAAAVAVSAGIAAITAIAARKLVTPPTKPQRATRVLELGEGWIRLTATPETRLTGRYGLWFDDDRGHAKLGEVLEEEPGWVRRELLAVDFGDLRAGVAARTGAAFYLSPRELGVPTIDVEVRTELGPAPAWLVPAGDLPADDLSAAELAAATGERWAILVHGRAAQRHEAIRAIPVIRSRGWTSLVISYRNDPGAPSSPDGRYALGDREWADVEAAIRFARRRGAKRIVLMGWSMGGALVLQTITRSAMRRSVESVILDSPVVDWVTALRFQARLNRLPPIVLPGVVRMVSSAWGRVVTGLGAPIDLGRLDLVRGAAALPVPILILHSVDDGFVPIDASRALAEARPDLVHLVEFQGAHHVRLWNHARAAWETAIDAWLSGLDAASASRAPRRRRP